MKSSLKILTIMSFAAVAVTGCYTERERAVVREPAGAAPATTRTIVRETVVVEAPPAPQEEVVGVAPTAGHVWIPGHWTREGDRWVWIGGRYEVRPGPTSVYVPGHWDNQGTGYVWREGYWK